MFSHQSLISIGIFVHIALCIGVTIHALYSRKETSSVLIWLIITYNIPYFGALLYFAFGVNKVNLARFTRRHLTEQLLDSKYTSEDRRVKMIDFLTSYRAQQAQEISSEFSREFDNALSKIYRETAVVGHNGLVPLITGDNFYPELFKAIDGAVHHIHIQSFIIQRDEIGVKLMEALKKKAEAGVTVRLMYDTFGSTKAHVTHFFRKYKKVENFHIEGWTLANPWKKQLQINLRNHRKSAIIDGKIGFFGGINFHKENITRWNLEPIRDYHFMIKGPGVMELQFEFLRDWIFMTNDSPDELFNSLHLVESEHYGDSIVRFINTGPEIHSSPMTDLYFLAITKAQSSIIIVTPYFLPNPEISQALKSARNTGVDVKIITPKKNNHKYAELAAKGRYSELLECGIGIYERGEPFMHAKAMIVDDEVAIVGSSNLDVRSLTLNYESNAVIYSESFVNELKAVVLFDKRESTPLDYNKWVQRSKFEVVMEDVCNLLAPII
ncbi:MAG: cardiolipin synthase [Kiritimatiellae bacterium]|jgi:cardiolipin synthase|nr:cardiolipin synthase [Kiritimatiellia bacterium]